MILNVAYTIHPARQSVRTSQIRDAFGLPIQAEAYPIAVNLELEIATDKITLFTGPSGSGKSSLLRAAADQMPHVDAAKLCLPDEPLIETVGANTAEAIRQLTATGLGEAQIMLRKPSELSDGQRYRFLIALAVTKGQTVVLDEFTATLDRKLAKVIAYNIRRTCDRSGKGFLIATTHEDIAEDLRPNCHVKIGTGGEITVRTKERERTYPSPRKPPVQRTRPRSKSGRNL